MLSKQSKADSDFIIFAEGITYKEIFYEMFCGFPLKLKRGGMQQFH